MVHLFENNHVFQHPWSVVSSAFWRKYPTEHAPHIAEVDSYDRKLDENGNLVTHRIIMSFGISLPCWVRSLVQADVGYTAETTVVNAAEKKMVIKSRTVTGNSIFSVDETCVYAANPADSSLTDYSQKATIKGYVPMVSGRLEKKIHETMTDKSKIGINVMENVCKRMVSHGFLSVFNDFKRPSIASHPSPIEELQHFAEDLAADLSAAASDFSAAASDFSAAASDLSADLSAAASIPSSVLSESSS